MERTKDARGLERDIIIPTVDLVEPLDKVDERCTDGVTRVIGHHGLYVHTSVNVLDLG